MQIFKNNKQSKKKKMIYFVIEIAGENKIFSQSKLPKPFRPGFPAIAESCSCTCTQ
jgi:hypothetical protein